MQQPRPPDAASAGQDEIETPGARPTFFNMQSVCQIGVRVHAPLAQVVGDNPHTLPLSCVSLRKSKDRRRLADPEETADHREARGVPGRLGVRAPL